KTDAQGRARCNLQLGLLYVAWAMGPADAAGGCFVSEPAHLVAAGRVVDLSAWEKREAVRQRLGGVAPWRKGGAVAVRWFPVAGEAFFIDLEIPEDGSLAMPRSPRSLGCLALIDAKSEVLVTTPVPVGIDDVVTFPIPREYVVTVKNNAGAPVTGA